MLTLIMCPNIKIPWSQPKYSVSKNMQETLDPLSVLFSRLLPLFLSAWLDVGTREIAIKGAPRKQKHLGPLMSCPRAK